MSIVIYERYRGISGTLGAGKESFSVGYVVQGTTDSSLVVEAVYNRAPPAVVGRSQVLFMQPFQIKEQGQGVWLADVDYQPPEDDKKNDDDRAEAMAFKLSWDTTGGTTKLTQSIDQNGKGTCVKLGGFPGDDSNAIGWDGKKCQGCTIPIPSLRITVDVFYDPRSWNFRRHVPIWARNTGKVNIDAWLGFKKGELLFMGCTGEETFAMLSGKIIKPVPVSFKVDCSENIAEDIILSQQLTVSGGKEGWDYLDVYYGEKKLDFGSGAVITVPEAHRFKVHRTQKRCSFREMIGIG